MEGLMAGEDDASDVRGKAAVIIVCGALIFSFLFSEIDKDERDRWRGRKSA